MFENKHHIVVLIRYKIHRYYSFRLSNLLLNFVDKTANNFQLFSVSDRIITLIII
ncbi:GSCOCG00000628001-RA-CDS [Cotesia congregata]|nr:GSCOCG00000628001-RA-CDS [Cotesia congregata]